ncbi:efflux RND transporter periplasmic adaptor subunit [Methylomonas sp. MO1]|uniref:efflux RND transporter periplasmic adaptor subunit n=1 Tax=unclassified Methylomonas TaxID=2608980 RepID=UPI00047AFF46|nr:MULTISPECIES: efflux RND transporter periplasmic adaptor subunit [unclassified Methylomonas]MDT4290479.1 efflux RND transporter periplasmic adaptor subunit [Methylomonas sp. MO1]
MPQSTASSSNRRGLRWLVVFLLAIAVAVGSWYLAKQPKNTDQDHAETVEVTLGDLEENVTAQGKLEPKEYVDVGAQVTGLLQKIYVKIGDNVQTGQLLAQIDPRIYAARVAAGEANIKNLQAQLTGQQAQVVFAQQQYDRNRELLQSKGISVQDFQNSEFTLKNAKATAESLQAQIEQVQSTLNGDKTNLGFTKIFASMDGTMVDQKAREGQTLNANQTTPTILQLAKLDTMTVRAQVAEADVMRLRSDMPVYFTTLGSGERRWQGTVRQILPTPEVINNVVLYNVLVDVDNRDRQLMTGMSTQMFFVLGKAEQVPLLPVNALGPRQRNQDQGNGHAYQVKVLTEQGPQDKIVQIGLRTRRFAQVVEGLVVGDRVQIAAGKEDKSKSRKKDQGYPGAGVPRL